MTGEENGESSRMKQGSEAIRTQTDSVQREVQGRKKLKQRRGGETNPLEDMQSANETAPRKSSTISPHRAGIFSPFRLAFVMHAGNRH